jgi:hypothetical protein
MPILGTVSSGFVELPYALSQTFNASGNYTVPAGKTKIAIVGCGGGGGGAAGFPSGGVKAGGAGGGVFSIREITTTPGTVYSVTVGAAGNGAASVGAYSNPGNGNSGGSTVFGSILTATGGQGGTGTNASSSWLSAIASIMAGAWVTATSSGCIAGGGGGDGRGIAPAGGAGGGGNARGSGGVANTGGGGGGDGADTGVAGAAGGSGIVIVRYAA